MKLRLPAPRPPAARILSFSKAAFRKGAVGSCRGGEFCPPLSSDLDPKQRGVGLCVRFCCFLTFSVGPRARRRVQRCY